MKTIKWPPKSIGMKRAMAHMRTGSRLMKMFTNGSPSGYAYYVVPGGYIEPVQAEQIIDRPDVYVYDDGLFPGIPQSWKIG
jgi:hypothetical protein